MTTAAPLFGTPSERSPRTISFAAGLALNASLVALALILHFPAAVPRAIAATVVLIAPERPVMARRIPPPQTRIVPARHFVPPAPTLRPHPTLVAPPEISRAMTSIPVAPRPAPLLTPAVKPPTAPRPVITGVFSTPQPIRLTASLTHVSAGTFPGAAVSAAPAERHAAIEEGSFTSGVGGGAVRSGSRDRHFAADAFGSAVNAPPQRRAAPSVQAATVFDAPAAAPEAHRPVPAANAIASAAVRILAKPKPQYTEEARRLRIEGEVWLEIVFRADGTVQIQRVIRPLGHGLDESAVAAARQIRFRPASDGSRNVDQIATIRVQFLLAD